MVVGNSSSGLTEVPSFKIPTVDIGNRQKGRIHAQTVIHSDTNEKDILDAINRAFSRTFRDSIQGAVNPYGRGGASLRIKNKLKRIRLGERLIKKEFYDSGCMQ
jgi:UDP-N-acetylglucosamine 2-epimerase